MPPIDPLPQEATPTQATQSQELPKEPEQEIAPVSSDVMRYLFHDHRTRTIISIIVVLALEGCLAYLGSILTQSFGPVIFLLPLAILVIEYIIAKQKADQLFFTAIAQSLNFTYTAKLPANTLASKLLAEKMRRRVRNILTGTVSGIPFRFCDYSYTVNEGKYSRTFPFSVFEVTLPKPIPEIVIRPKASGLFSQQEFSTFFLSIKELHLEGDFDKHFSASTTAGKEIEALQLLQPNTMAALIDNYGDWIIECTGTLLYCIQAGALPENETALRALLTKAEALTRLLLPEAKNI